MNHALELRHVRYTYPSGQEALRGVSLSVASGESVALVGANSAGKSTLLLLCNGCLLPDEGSVYIGAHAVTPQTLGIVRRQVGTVFQDADDQLFMPSIAEDVAFGPHNLGLTPVAIRQRVREALEAVGCAHLAQRQPHHLSGGEKRAVAIATVLAMRPEVLLLDEPTSNLDPRARRRFIHLIQELEHTRIIATHDLDMVLEVCPRTVVLYEGRIIADGSTETLFSDTALLDASGLEPPLCMQPVPGRTRPRT